MLHLLINGDMYGIIKHWWTPNTADKIMLYVLAVFTAVAQIKRLGSSMHQRETVHLQQAYQMHLYVFPRNCLKAGRPAIVMVSFRIDG